MTSLNGPSPNLSWLELACHDAARTPYPAEWRLSRALRLAVEFERLRAIVGAPLVVASGYRTPEHNRAVGGAKHSQHVQGYALDLVPPKGVTVAGLLGFVKAVASEGESAIRGIGLYRSFVHMDVRPGDRLVVWGGVRAAAEVTR